MFDRSSLPAAVTVYEVGPRDGLQNESVVLPTSLKADLIRRLVGAGVPAIEVASFVRPDIVPALADAEELLAELAPLLATHRMSALVPNQRGLDRAMQAGVHEIAVFASATESFAKANLNNTVAGSLEIFGPVIKQARDAGLRVRGYISMCFGDPWEGKVATNQVVDVAERLFADGITELSLGDTIGVATPGDVIDLLDACDTRGIARSLLAVHFHDTYGQALSNTLTALLEGITTVDSSIAGLGGCPFAKSATGNLATEDLVWQLHGLGISTGIDFEALLDTSRWLRDTTGLAIRSKTAIALMDNNRMAEKK
ncbi:MAG: hydroxymethylglutaryl-CoA lyase [Candidatus Nanopelagicaceae bacterium]|nr:hydroxymethylglutaryl-CoA lyase [Candidatus Nanopelagicaceae bacterium]